MPIAAFLVGWTMYIVEPPAWFWLGIYPMIFATGAGWLLLGRWDIGAVVAVGRLVVLGVAFWLMLDVVFSSLDCLDCDNTRFYMSGALFIAVFVFTTLSSIGGLVWALRRDSIRAHASPS
jgi:hypothetical protein